MKDIVTAIDILNEQAQLEQDAKESLPGKFETCTFSLGYVRQTLYACQTCSTTLNNNLEGNGRDTSQATNDDDKGKESFKAAGMCYSCSIACHADHVLYELFPKRHFRCDCGLKNKFGQHPCQLSISEKHCATNEENKYNHNFEGRYCRCNQIYDSSIEEGTMYQCVLCEDWFHERCIGNIPDEIEEFEGYACRTCVKNHPYMAIQDQKFNFGICKPGEPIHRWAGPSIRTTSSSSSSSSSVANGKRKLDQVGPEDVETSTKKQKLDDEGDECKTVHDILKDDEMLELFLEEGWREKLCRCKKCGPRYKADNIEFILQEETTIEPEEDEDAGKSLLEIGMEQLSRMNRVEALDGLRMYQNLWDQIKPFLRTFQESGRVVTANDIQTFFDQRRREREEEKNKLV
ncbi:hypothetical protein BC941DRAFT_503946 [Chlamydoabsidia padenii]|nr:hypothetical protein BC941DRAFT_503946 [Chlamydoabsidia padenii]